MCTGPAAMMHVVQLQDFINTEVWECIAFVQSGVAPQPTRRLDCQPQKSWDQRRGQSVVTIDQVEGMKACMCCPATACRFQ